MRPVGRRIRIDKQEQTTPAYKGKGIQRAIERVPKIVVGDVTIAVKNTDTLSQFDRRTTNAAEYIAYHLGQIDKKLDRLITLLEASAKERS